MSLKKLCKLILAYAGAEQFSISQDDYIAKYYVNDMFTG